MDIEAGKEKLDIVGALAQRMVKKAGISMTVHLSTDLDAALKGASFVTTQIRVGQLAARIQDEKIPLRYGVLGQETTGPGGFMKAQRTIPVLLDLCKNGKAVPGRMADKLHQSRRDSDRSACET